MKYQWALSTLEGAFENWNIKLTELWGLLTQSPESFRGGQIWNIIVAIHNTMQAIGLATLVVFFFLGVLRTGSYLELQRPQQAFRLVLRFALAYTLVVYGMDIMLKLVAFGQGLVSEVMISSGLTTAAQTVPETMRYAVSSLSLLQAALFWVLGLVASICTTVMSIIILLQVYGRFFKLYIFIVISPIPLSASAGEGTESITRSFIKSFALVCLEGLIVVLACIIFSSFAASPPNMEGSGLTPAESMRLEELYNTDTSNMGEIDKMIHDAEISGLEAKKSGQVNADAFGYAWNYLTETLFSMLLLVGTIKMSSSMLREMFGN